jgi:hypothetical protein
MFFVEREPGKLEAYDSPDHLSAAIRRGEVGPESRIFHRTASKWLSITKHPLYRQSSAQPVPEQPRPVGRNHWTFFPAPAPSPREMVAEPALEPAGAAREETLDSASSALRSAPRRGWTESLRLVLGRLRLRGQLETS